MVKNNILADSGKRIAKVISPIINALNPLNKKGENGKEGKRRGKIRILKHNNIIWVNVESPTSREISKLSDR